VAEGKVVAVTSPLLPPAPAAAPPKETSPSLPAPSVPERTGDDKSDDHVALLG
jgi:hypothetical protein